MTGNQTKPNIMKLMRGLPRWCYWLRISLPKKKKKESACQYRSRGFDPWVPWRRKWEPTPVFLPGEFHGQRSLVGYSSWDRKKSQTRLGTHTHILVRRKEINKQIHWGVNLCQKALSKWVKDMSDAWNRESESVTLKFQSRALSRGDLGG